MQPAHWVIMNVYKTCYLREDGRCFLKEMCFLALDGATAGRFWAADSSEYVYVTEEE